MDELYESTKQLEDMLSKFVGARSEMSASTLQAGVERFLRRRSIDFQREVFKQHADPVKDLIFPKGLHSALEELGIQIKLEEVEAIILIADLGKNGGLDFEEFQCTVRNPQTKLHQWIETLPLAALLASCFILPEGDQLHEITLLTSDNLDAIADAFTQGLKKILADSQIQLRKIIQNMEIKAKAKEGGESSKFKTFKMSAGVVSDYVQGLSGRIGM